MSAQTLKDITESVLTQIQGGGKGSDLYRIVMGDILALDSAAWDLPVLTDPKLRERVKADLGRLGQTYRAACEAIRKGDIAYRSSHHLLLCNKWKGLCKIAQEVRALWAE